MKRLALALALWLLPAWAFAQCSGTVPNNYFCANTSGAQNVFKGVPISALPITSAQLDTLLGSTKGFVAVRGASVWAGFPNGVGVFTNDGAGNLSWTPAGTGTVTNIATSTGILGGPITNTGTISADIATPINIWTIAQNKIVDASGAGLSLSPIGLTFASPLALNMATFINATVTLTGNTTIANPTNPIIGRCGTIYLQQDASGSRTITFSSPTNWKFPSGTLPTATTTANATDFLTYCVRTSTFIAGALNKDFK